MALELSNFPGYRTVVSCKGAKTQRNALELGGASPVSVLLRETDLSLIPENTFDMLLARH